MKTLGFIGGGRITRIILEALKKSNIAFDDTFVYDINEEVLSNLGKKFPKIHLSSNSSSDAFLSDLVFISLHPPAIPEIIKNNTHLIRANSIIVSLAPKIKLSKLIELFSGFDRIVRMNPNAPTIIGKGFCPTFYSDSITTEEKAELKRIFEAFGDCPEVEENKIESFAIITAMGPTYLNFQIYKLYDLAIKFGLSEEEAKNGLYSMINGTTESIFNSKLSREEILDLVPVKPLKNHENEISEFYDDCLITLYEKLKS